MQMSVCIGNICAHLNSIRMQCICLIIYFSKNFIQINFKTHLYLMQKNIRDYSINESPGNKKSVSIGFPNKFFENKI